MSRPPSPLARLAPLVPRLAMAWRRNSGEPPELLRPAAKPGGRHIGLLVSLGLGGPGSVSELAARLDMSKAHASLVVGELAKAGLVEREADLADRRRVIVSLSAAAKPALAEMHRRHAEPLERFLAELVAEDAERFIVQLTRLVEVMHDHSSE